jgi:hypothetical protein
MPRQPKFKPTAAQFPRIDLTNPAQFATVTQNVVNIHRAGTRQEHQAGEAWYPQVHEAVEKGVHGTSVTPLAGAGIVGVTSPNMDFTSTNLPSFHEAFKLRPKHWKAIEASAAQPRVPTGRMTRAGRPETKMAPRTQESAHAVSGMALASIPDTQLVKVHRLIRGENPYDVLPRATSPKTHSFMTNIAHPGEGCAYCGDPPEDHVAIDARAFDMGTNILLPFEYSGRGIESAAAQRPGHETRYEGMERVYRTAGAEVGVKRPETMQAQTWVTGKRIETSVPTKKGTPRVTGVYRRGQSYTSML